MNGHCLTNEQILAFSTALFRAERSQATVEKYLRSVRAFFLYQKDRPVTKDNVMAWKRYLQREENYSPSTVNASLAALNSLFNFLGWSDCRTHYLKIQRRLFRETGRELDRADYEKLIAAALGLGRERIALVMETICATGIRVGKVGYITVEAARAGRTEIYLKGKIRTILIPRKLCGKLLRYARRQRTGSGKIFLTRRRNPLSRVQIWSEMKKLCAAAGVMESKVFPHNLRHLFARTYYSLYKDIVKLADLLGHSSVNTTRIYLLTDGAEHIWQLERMNLLC